MKFHFESLSKNDSKSSKYRPITNALKEFCLETTVHGFRCFIEENRHWTERIWWLISFVLSVVLCAISIQNLWDQWQDRPVLVSFNGKMTSINTIPFPAVTICINQRFSNNTRICTLYDSECSSGLFKNFSSNKWGCLLDCASITYDFDVSNIQATDIARVGFMYG